MLRLPRRERIETGVEQGSEVTPFYDPMIAKLVVHRETRAAAIEAMAAACGSVAAWPVRQNAWFLARLMRLPEFASGAMTTGTIAARIDRLTARPEPSDEVLGVAAIEAFATHAEPDEWERLKGLMGFRLNAPRSAQAWLSLDGETRPVQIDLKLDGPARHDVTAAWAMAEPVYFEQGAAFAIRPARTDGSDEGGPSNGAILAPMPGTVIALDVAQGDSVTKGQRLMVLEAMKMEHALVAPYDGVVSALNAVAGTQVQVDALLASIGKAED